ncbi:hypothetical protein ACA910_018443 [Epithemia clementina (nom. ined.)]
MLGGGLSLASTSAAAAAATRHSAATVFLQSATPPPLDPESEHKTVAKRRMGNLISSRWNRERQLDPIRLLKEDSSQLTTNHERLLREQARLQALHGQMEEQCVGLVAAEE